VEYIKTNKKTPNGVLFGAWGGNRVPGAAPKAIETLSSTFDCTLFVSLLPFDSICGAWGGNRTLNPLRAWDFKSHAYASSATQAQYLNLLEASTGVEPV
jgi:hypothetical protein